MIDEMILDNEKRIKEIDKDDMYKFLMNMPKNCDEMLTMVKKIQFSHELKEFRFILICGMGGSAIGGNLAHDLLIDKIPIPIIIHRGYEIPAFVNNKTLMIVISYSGNTEETLSIFAEGIQRHCTIFGISSNGKLIEYCKKFGIEYVKVPANIQPRAAIPYLFIAILIILQKMKIISDISQDLEEAISQLTILKEEMSIKSLKTNNIAKKIAIGIQDTIPMIYASSGYASLARRMKCQINENSKNIAHWDEFPELNHNEIVGWELSSIITKNSCVILLRSHDENEVIKNRIEITKQIILKDKVKDIFEIWSRGTSRLAKIFSLLFIGDCVSYYLAILNNVDPSQVRSISELKRRIKEKMNNIKNIENKLFSA
ncbi:MAG: bifunctional phosphoglucose/phosphomannose isomerase [Promethearchaeota archaeon]